MNTKLIAYSIVTSDISIINDWRCFNDKNIIFFGTTFELKYNVVI